MTANGFTLTRRGECDEVGREAQNLCRLRWVPYAERVQNKTKSRRTPIPPKTAEDVMVASAHTCCICRQDGRDVNLHHINGDPSDHRMTNLAPLCSLCHTNVGTKGRGRKITQPEVLRFKKEWEIICKIRHKLGSVVPLSEKSANCDKCGQVFPEWFLEPFAVGSDQQQKLCRCCTEEWPRPKDGECEDEYVRRLLRWRNAKRRRSNASGQRTPRST
jgi:hypothetical protein